MPDAQVIDNQPISATFFNEGNWITDFITPDALEVKKLYDELTKDALNSADKVLACWSWVSNEVVYKTFISAKIWIDGRVSNQPDYWQKPSMCIRTRLGNCTNKSFLLTSLLRNELPEDRVYCVLGNLYNGKPGGHAWVIVVIDGIQYIMESTRPDAQPLVLADVATRYEPVHLFNDKVVTAVQGVTLLEPFTRCYSTWLRDYLDWAYINGRK